MSGLEPGEGWPWSREHRRCLGMAVVWSGESPPVLVFFCDHFLQTPVFSKSGRRDQLLVWAHISQAPGGGILGRTD